MSSAAPAPGRSLPPHARRRPAGLAWLRHWPARARRTAWLAAVPACLLAALAAVFYAQLAAHLWHGTLKRNDFFALWSWSAMVHSLTHPLAIYTPARVQAFLQAERPGFQGHYPFAYPPSFLLLIWPLGLVRRPLAYAIWVALSLAAYLAATIERPWRRPLALLVVLAPATAFAVETGQDGLLLAALLLGGCRLLPRRPVLAGVMFGLVSCKPQFGPLIPVALLASGQWRAIAAATATVLATVLASAAAFGWAMWAHWAGALWDISGFVAGRARLYPLMATMTGALHLLGAGPLLRTLVQTAAALLAGLGVWLCWRRGTGRLARAALQAGCFLVTPYAFFYDLPIVTGALINIVLERQEADAAFGAGEVLALLAAVLLPGLMIVGPGHVPWAGLVLPALFALIVVRALRAGPTCGPAQGPGGAPPGPTRPAQPAVRPAPGPSAKAPSPSSARTTSATAKNAGYS